MKQLFLSAAEEDEIECDSDFAESESMSPVGEAGRSADDSLPMAEILDETSRDSGICMMDATSGDDYRDHSFSFSGFNTSVSGDDSFTELTFGASLTSFPVPGASDHVTRRVSRVLSFDDALSPSSSPRRSPCLGARPAVRAHRRHQRLPPPTRSDDVTPPEPLSGHVTAPPPMAEDEDRADLIGDMTTIHALPLEPNSKHADLKTITPDTLAAVLNDRYADVIDEIQVIDCRYPYEYDGGHIVGARNICTRDEIESQFLSADGATSDTLTSRSTKRSILVFHCEFSSERAPKLLRFLRNADRAAHADCYPRLRYPEIYLLAGGYKAFYESHPTTCRPMSYRPMLDSDHTAELRHFRLKAKSWAGDRKQRQRAPRTLTARRHTLQL